MRALLSSIRWWWGVDKAICATMVFVILISAIISALGLFTIFGHLWLLIR